MERPVGMTTSVTGVGTEPLDQLALNDADPAVQLVAILSRVRAADDPVLAAVSKSEHTQLVELASLVVARLTRSGPCYSRLTPGLRALRGGSEAQDSAK